LHSARPVPIIGQTRLKAMAVEYQAGFKPVNPTVVNAAYNFHVHTKSCFSLKNNSKKRKQNNGNDNVSHPDPCVCVECRYRYPKRAQRKTHIRHAYDAFQNEYCKAVTQSRLCCNSNVTFVMYGRVGQYNFKYAVKGTQEDDTKDYNGVQEGFQRANFRLQQSPEKSDISKACSMVLSASYSHQKTNIVGAAMASYLTQRGSRFIFSHSSVWCPLQDLISLLENKTINTNVRFAGSTCFYMSFAMDYLCRPERLEQCSVRDFFTTYEVIKDTLNGLQGWIRNSSVTPPPSMEISSTHRHQ